MTAGTSITPDSGPEHEQDPYVNSLVSRAFKARDEAGDQMKNVERARAQLETAILIAKMHPTPENIRAISMLQGELIIALAGFRQASYNLVDAQAQAEGGHAVLPAGFTTSLTNIPTGVQEIREAAKKLITKLGGLNLDKCSGDVIPKMPEGMAALFNPLVPPPRWTVRGMLNQFMQKDYKTLQQNSADLTVMYRGIQEDMQSGKGLDKEQANKALDKIRLNRQAQGQAFKSQYQERLKYYQAHGLSSDAAKKLAARDMKAFLQELKAQGKLSQIRADATQRMIIRKDLEKTLGIKHTSQSRASGRYKAPQADQGTTRHTSSRSASSRSGARRRTTPPETAQRLRQIHQQRTL